MTDMFMDRLSFFRLGQVGFARGVGEVWPFRHANAWNSVSRGKPRNSQVVRPSWPPPSVVRRSGSRAGYWGVPSKPCWCPRSTLG